MKLSFWEMLDALVQAAELVIDRPKGSAHPCYPLIIYPLDYGYLAGTTSGDGQGIDVWRGSLSEGWLDAIICTADVFKQDVEIKLLLGCTAEEKALACRTHDDSEFMAAILVERETADTPHLLMSCDPCSSSCHQSRPGRG